MGWFDTISAIWLPSPSRSVIGSARSDNQSSQLQSQRGSSRNAQPNQSQSQFQAQNGPRNPPQFQPTLTTPVKLQSPGSRTALQVRPIQLQPQFQPPPRQSFPINQPISSMASSRQGRLDPREAEAKAELQNPRGQPAEYVDQRQNPEWRKAKMDKAIEKARGRSARNSGLRSLVQPRSPMPSISALQSTHGQPNYRGSSTMTSPQQYEDPHDQKMAMSQLDMDHINDNSREYFVQDEWAKSQLRKIGNTCPRGCRWIRIEGGYRCGQGFHWATDQMVSEGEGEVITSLRVVPKGFLNHGKAVKTGSRYD
ncbi:hypothetical protein EAF04_007496 [Stromatinia cepivora]|nr:hypothetical protein EAF04_007496 [Stromatinia cepivora]